MRRKPTLSSLKRKCWRLVSEWVRRSHADEGGFCGCYTCGAPIHWKYEAQAGHAIPGRTNSVLLDDSIIRPQCYGCNCARGGMHHVFATKLIRENGMDWWEEKLAGSRQPKKYTKTDIEDLISEYRTKLEAL